MNAREYATSEYDAFREFVSGDDERANFNIGGILGGASDAVDRVTGEARESGEQKFRRYLRDANLAHPSTSGTVDLTAGEYEKVAEFVVPAQEQYRWGFGSAENAANQGYMYFDAKDGGDSFIPGTIRIQQRDAQQRNVVTVEEHDLSTLNNSKSNRDQMIPLPLQRDFPKVGRDSKLVLAIDPDSDVTFSWANSETIMPTTVYPVNNA